jgi:hypothetical protein
MRHKDVTGNVRKTVSQCNVKFLLGKLLIHLKIDGSERDLLENSVIIVGLLLQVLFLWRYSPNLGLGLPS